MSAMKLSCTGGTGLALSFHARPKSSFFVVKDRFRDRFYWVSLDCSITHRASGTAYHTWYVFVSSDVYIHCRVREVSQPVQLTRISLQAQ